MGVVFRARPLGSSEIVALKMIRTDRSVEENEIGRFRVEARTAGSLQHRHIVPIHDIGQHEGRQFFTMKLAAGGSLAGRRDGFRRSPQAAAGLMEKVARAVHHAHRHGILHRDLKPSNILLDDDGEPLVCDFGLAKFAGSQTVVSQSAPVGTPPYMAPEQVQWPCEGIGPETDVWALGVILYELVTGERPFQGESFAELTYRILFVEPRPPRAVNPEVPRHLETIILNCLEKRPALRYSSAEALAQDLAHCIRGTADAGPMRRKGPGFTGLLRRHPAAALAISAAAVVGGLVFHGAIGSDGSRGATAAADPLAEARRNLAEGRPAVLVGAVGQPAWSDWILGGANAKLQTLPTGTALAQCWDIELLRLWRGPLPKRFRFTAEVRHLAGGNDASAGIYVGRRQQEVERGTANVYFALTFNDQVRPPPGDTNPARGAARLNLQVLHEDAGRKGISTSACGVRRFTVRGPDEQSDYGWRRLCVEVDGERLRAFWDGEPMGVLDWKDAVTKTAALALDMPFRGAVPPQFNSEIGIYILRGAAEFRPVTVEPLEPGR